MLLLHGKSRQKEMNIENTFSELKKKQKNIILLSTPSCQSFSDYLLMTMQWLRLFCETAGTLNIYISYEHLTFCSCNTSKKNCVFKFFVLKIDDHKLCPPSGKTQFKRQLIKQTSNAVCVDRSEDCLKKEASNASPLDYSVLSFMDHISAHSSKL